MANGRKIELTFCIFFLIIFFYIYLPSISISSCYVRFDIIRRILTDHFKIPVYLVLGMTDIDDKIIQKAKEKSTHPLEWAKKNEHSFMSDMVELGVNTKLYKYIYIYIK